MQSCHFYFASTPLHVYLSSAIALTKPEAQHVLLLIDQPEVKDNLYFHALNQWQGSPFLSVHIFEGRIKGVLNKVRSRKRIFQQIKNLVAEYAPVCLLTGNDRRIEFQYAMSIAPKTASGVYIDEGTFTYVGREASSKVGDAMIDSLGKKLTYGLFWKNPPTIGGSSWIKSIYVAFPDYIHPLLAKKQVLKLEQRWLADVQLKAFSNKILALQNYDPKCLGDLDAFVALPHESLMQSESARKDWGDALNKLCKKYARLGIKYHPRDTHEDLLTIKQQGGVVEIPRQVNFESLLPHLSNECDIVGDFSSVLINARWLRPELAIFAVVGEDNPNIEKFRQFYTQLSIHLVKLEHLVGA